MNGRNAREGFVEVALSNGETGTICADNWGTFAAQVVCRQVGYDYAETPLQVSTTVIHLTSKSTQKFYLAM